MRLILFTACAAPLLVAAAPDTREPDRAPSAMTSREIAAHNTGLSASHDRYIRCRKSAPTGSIIANQRECRTVAKWREMSALGNQDARDVVNKWMGQHVDVRWMEDPNLKSLPPR